MNADDRAVCGLICPDCPIYRATYDPNAANLLLGWFKELNLIGRHDGIEELMESGPYCQGCQGPRSSHWSADCWILHCCVEERGLSTCYLCDEFPCNDLKHWSAQDDKYASAFAYLTEKNRRLNR